MGADISTFVMNGEWDLLGKFITSAWGIGVFDDNFLANITISCKIIIFLYFFIQKQKPF